MKFFSIIRNYGWTISGAGFLTGCAVGILGGDSNLLKLELFAAAGILFFAAGCIRKWQNARRRRHK